MSTIVESKDLKKFKVKARDGLSGQVVSTIYDKRTLSLKYLVIKAEHDSNTAYVVLSRGSFRNIDPSSKTIELFVETKELINAPEANGLVELEKYEQINEDDERLLDPRFLGITEVEGEKFYAFDKINGKQRLVENNKFMMGELEKEFLFTDKEGRQYEVYDHNSNKYGAVDTFGLNYKTFKIDFLVASNRTAIEEKRVLLRPEWVESVNWGSGTFYVPLTKSGIHSAHSYTRDALNKAVIKNTDEYFAVDISQGRQDKNISEENYPFYYFREKLNETDLVN